MPDVAHRARQRLVRDPARRRPGAPGARARSSSTPGRPSRSTRSSSAASGARAVTVPVNDRHEHDLDAMAAEITAATRLVIVCNPNNPTSTALPFEQHQGVRRAGAVAHRAHHRRGLLRVLDARRPGRDARPPRRPPEPRPAAHLLEGLRPRGPARRLRSVRLGGLRRRGQPGPPAVLRERRRPGRGRRGAASTATPSPSASSARWSPASTSRRASPRLGMQVADSQANFVWFDLPEDADEPDDRPLA